MVNLLLDYCPVHVIRAEAQRDLRNLRRHHLPIRLYVRKVVEHEAADCDLLDVEHASCFRQMLQRGVIWMESQRNKRLEAAGFVLQGAELHQMIDAVFVILDMPVEHGRIRL